MILYTHRDAYNSEAVLPCGFRDVKHPGAQGKSLPLLGQIREGFHKEVTWEAATRKTT